MRIISSFHPDVQVPALLRPSTWETKEGGEGSGEHGLGGREIYKEVRVLSPKMRRESLDLMRRSSVSKSIMWGNGGGETSRRGSSSSGSGGGSGGSGSGSGSGSGGSKTLLLATRAAAQSRSELETKIMLLTKENEKYQNERKKMKENQKKMEKKFLSLRREKQHLLRLNEMLADQLRVHEDGDDNQVVQRNTTTKEIMLGANVNSVMGEKDEWCLRT